MCISVCNPSSSNFNDILYKLGTLHTFLVKRKHDGVKLLKNIECYVRFGICKNWIENGQT